MTKKPFLIFDAGGVLVFPDFRLLANIAKQAGIKTSPDDISKQHARLFRAIDEHIAQSHQIPPIQYFLDIFKMVTDSQEKALEAYELTLEADRVKHIWTTTRPWVSTTIQQLRKQGYQMALISNSDGRVEQILIDMDLREYFEIVIDSFVVGVEKPDTRIFELALSKLKWNPAETIYIGDIFYIDVWGANQAGLGAIHLDSMGLYSDWRGVRITSINELPNLLTTMDGNLESYDLYPAKNFELKISLDKTV